MELIIVKVVMAATALIFIYVFLLFYLNIEAPDGNKNFFLLVASVVPLLGIAFTLITTSSIYKKTICSCFFMTRTIANSLQEQIGIRTLLDIRTCS